MRYAAPGRSPIRPQCAKRIKTTTDACALIPSPGFAPSPNTTETLRVYLVWQVVCQKETDDRDFWLEKNDMDREVLLGVRMKTKAYKQNTRPPSSSLTEADGGKWL